VSSTAEVTYFAFGYDSNGPQLNHLNFALEASNRTGLERELPSNLGAGADALWLVPPLRWLWLSSGYSYFSAANEDGVELSAHTFESGPALYVDLFPLVVHLEVGATLIKPSFSDRRGVLGQDSDEWLQGGHLVCGLSVPLKGRLGFQGLLRYQKVGDYSISGTGVDFDGGSIRIGLAYLPDEDSALINWDW
jgi:hypothetical protein